jgi:hypothetical protein
VQKVETGTGRKNAMAKDTWDYMEETPVLLVEEHTGN